MKIMTIFAILGLLVRIAVLPAATLPKYPIMGTEPLKERRTEMAFQKPRHMSDKMFYLKTGRRVNSEINHMKQQNYWGPGIPTKVRFPSHLAMWEEARRTGIKRR
ncbi:MAG: hypothetical protein PVH45_03680 [Candidatus Omnitrophota bacterium]|jgi:hypothetical protein